MIFKRDWVEAHREQLEPWPRRLTLLSIWLSCIFIVSILVRIAIAL